MSEKKDELIDLSAMENLEPAFLGEVEKIDKEDIKEIKEEVIDEVESLEEFLKDKSKKEVDDEEEEVEKVETTEDTEKEVETETGKKNDEEEVSPIRAIAEWAGSKGIFEFDPDKFEDSEDYLESKLTEVAETKFNSWKEELPEEIHQLIDNYKEGIPLDELIYSRSREIEYSNITEEMLGEDVELQKRIVSDWLANNDLEDKQIKKKIERYSDAGLLSEEAETALAKLKAFEKRYQEQLKEEAQERKQQFEHQKEQKIKEVEKTILSSEEIIPGIKLSKEERKKLTEGYLKMNSKGETQLIKKLKEDPMANLKIAQFFLLMDGKLDSVKAKLESKVVGKIRQTVDTKTETESNPLQKLDIGKMRKAIELAKKART